MAEVPYLHARFPPRHNVPEKPARMSPAGARRRHIHGPFALAATFRRAPTRGSYCHPDGKRPGRAVVGQSPQAGGNVDGCDPRWQPFRCACGNAGHATSQSRGCRPVYTPPQSYVRLPQRRNHPSGRGRRCRLPAPSTLTFVFGRPSQIVAAPRLVSGYAAALTGHHQRSLESRLMTRGTPPDSADQVKPLMEGPDVDPRATPNGASRRLTSSRSASASTDRER